MPNLVGVAEIARMFRITRQGVDKIVRTHPDFPAPVAVLSAGRIWEREAIEQWARTVGRTE